MLYFELAVVVVLTLFNGVLAMSELSIVSARQVRIKHLKSLSEKQKRSVLQLKEDPSRFLSTVQIGITLVGIFAGTFSGATLAERLGKWLDSYAAIAPHGHTIGIAVTVAGITYLALIVGELVPKRIALSHPEQIAGAMAGPMIVLARISAPAVWLLKLSTEVILRLLRLSEIKKSDVTEEEIKALIVEGTQSGVFAPQEREMIEGVLRLADRPSRIIMTPRADIAWVDVEEDWRHISATLAQTHFSRLLVCEGDVDYPVGVVEVKDILPLALRCEQIDIRALLKPALFIPEGVSVLKLMEHFKREKLHVAVVVDEHGTTEGIITLTDVLEAIAGELPEYGEEADQRIVRREDGSWLVDGELPIDEFEAHLGFTGLCDDPGVYTIAGFVMHAIERIPEVGVNYRHRNVRFEVVDMDGLRIDKVVITLDGSEADPPKSL